VNSSAAFVPRTAPVPGGPHRAFPVGGTYRSERTGALAVLTDEHCYPVTAECKVCHGPIRLGQLLQMEWRHAPAAAAAITSAPVSPGRGLPGAGCHPPTPGSTPGAETNGEG
jgi:hypothetical protein